MNDKYKKRSRPKNALCWFFIVVVIVIIVLSLYFSATAANGKEHYLPIVIRAGPTVTPTRTPRPTPTLAPTYDVCECCTICPCGEQ